MLLNIPHPHWYVCCSFVDISRFCWTITFHSLANMKQFSKTYNPLIGEHFPPLCFHILKLTCGLKDLLNIVKLFKNMLNTWYFYIPLHLLFKDEPTITSSGLEQELPYFMNKRWHYLLAAWLLCSRWHGGLIVNTERGPVFNSQVRRSRSFCAKNLF